MTKKIVAAIISAVFLIGACVFGFVYSGLDANFPKAESKIKIAEPEFMIVLLEDAPSFRDYYAGRVKAGLFNGKAFHTFSASGRYLQNETDRNDSGDRHRITKSRWTASYGKDSMYITIAEYGAEDVSGGTNEASTEVDFYIAENVCYFRMRKYDINMSLTDLLGSDAEGLESVLKKCYQTHLNEWIDKMPFSTLVLNLMRDATIGAKKIITNYTTDKNGASEEKKWTRNGGVFIRNDNLDTETASYRIDLTGGVPYFEAVRSATRDSASATGEEHYEFFGFDTTKVSKPHRVVDAASVFQECVDYVTSMAGGQQ